MGNSRTVVRTAALRAAAGVWVAGAVMGVGGGSACGQAVVGTYAQSPIMVADGTTVYTAWVYADNTGLGGVPTWGAQYSFLLPGYATPIAGGVGVAYDKPDAARDFFEGDAMVFETLLGPGVASGRLVNPADLATNKVGDLQYYKFTINAGAAAGAGSFDLGPDTALNDSLGGMQAFTEQNVAFVITSLAGDFTLDGFVGISDLNVVLGNWNNAYNTYASGPGDSSGDGFVGIEDLNWVLGNWNAGTPPGAAPGSAVNAAPEPAGAVMVISALACARSRRLR